MRMLLIHQAMIASGIATTANVSSASGYDAIAIIASMAAIYARPDPPS